MNNTISQIPGLRNWTGLIPFVVILTLWWMAPRLFDYPAYILPTPGEVFDEFVTIARNGTLWTNTLASMERLAVGFVIGNLLAFVLGIAIATNKAASEYLRPLLTFFQSIAGIAWIPLAIIWFGVGIGAISFVIANTVFFSGLNNVVVGVQQIPKSLHRAARSHGAHGAAILTQIIIPGALAQILLGMRTSMAFGWRALVAGEMIAGTDGLGYMTMEAVRWYQSSTIILGMLLVGAIWLLIDRLIFASLERRTVVRWGMVKRL